ncbi:glycosyltransferase [Flavobacterium sp. DGU38]|uniref:Glycosyltransferase n=1 Tax=Flavobacterium calami TaxID=3139144 RepID=A0ABU9IS63_9FLAO
MEEKYTNRGLEIIVSTMNRNSLDFLIPMFPFSHFSNFSILIINQTNRDQILLSDYPSVRVINSFEKGLSKSRNLGIKNAIGKIVLIADDDVVFIENFQEKIIKAYNENQNATAICFQTLTKDGHFYSNYPKHQKELNNRKIRKVLSIELTCKLEDLRKHDCVFNELFGLGSKFQDSETFFFLKSIRHKKLRVIFYPFQIVIHEAFSSSDDAGSDRVIYARMAGYYKIHGIFSYLFLFKYMFFLFRKYNLPVSEIKKKFAIGLSGIYDYRLILNKKLDSRYE